MESGSKIIRFVTMMTDECSRVSGRTASSPNLAKKYWKYINSRTYNKWSSISSGIDKYTGAVTEYECDLRDYPTIDELSMNLSNSSMGVSVLFTGRENDQCADVEDYSKGEFWDLIVDATNESGAAFAYNSASGDSEDMAEKLLSGIQSILSDVCAGIEEGTTAPSGSETTSTVIGGSEGSSGSTAVIGESEGSNGTGTTVAGGKTTVIGGSEGSSGSSTDIGGSEGSNGTGTTVVGGSTTLTTAAGCKDGIPIGVDLEWIHIHDASSSMKDMHSETSSALKSVVDIVNEILLSENTSDRLSFSLVEAHDKSVACSLFDSDCSCTDVSAHRVSLSEMSCSLNSDCSVDSFFTEDMYIDISARPSLFDPLMTMSQTYSDSIESGSKMIRFVTMMTDECSRVSGRAASSPNLAKKYWKYINSRTYNKWSSISSG